MGVHHVRGYFRRLACRGLVLAGSVGLGLIPTFGAQAAVVEGSITGFVPNPFPATGGAYTRVGSWQWAFGRSVAQYEASALGRTVVGEAVITAAPTAGRALAGACLSNPLGIVACTAVAGAAWFALSRIHWDSDKWNIDEDEYGACYTTHGPINGGAFLPCSISPSGAVASWVNTANANNYGDGHFTDSDGEATYSTLTTPSPFAVNGTGTAHVQRHYVVTYHNSNPSTVQNFDETITVYRQVDQMSTYTRPATAGDMNNHGDAHSPPPDVVMNDWSGPVPTLSPDFSKGVGTAGDPYPGDDSPNEGPWKQDRVTTVGKPETTNPMDLETGTDTVNVDNPNTPGNEGDGDPSDPDTPGDDDQPQAEQLDLCKEHPEISACQPLGNAPDDQVPKQTIDVTYSPEDIGLPSTCPAPIPMGSHGMLSFEPACDAAVKIKPLVVALGAFVALLIMNAAIRRA